MNKNTKIGLAIAAVVLVAILAWAVIPRITQPDSSSVSIAINVPMTGPISAWSGQFANGFQMGIDDACKEHGLSPEEFRVDVQDNGGDPAKAVSAFNMQKLKGFDAYISVATGPANANSKELDDAGIPHFIAAFDPLITTLGKDRFRIMANSKLEAPLFIDYAKRKNAKRIFVLQINMAYAEEQWSTLIIPELEKFGATVIRERFELQDRDFRTIAQKASAANADLIYVCGYSFHVQPALAALRTNGLVQRGRVLSVMDFVDLVYTGTSVEELRDVIFVSPIFDIPGKVPGAADWRQRYEERFDMKPTYVPAYAYDNAKLLVKAYADSQKIDTSTIMAAQPFTGINGEIKLDGDRDIVATVALAEVDDEGRVKEFKE